MSNVAGKTQGKSPRAPAKLSSGILGMKFMQKDESATPSPPSQPEKPSSDATNTSREADPGAWFSPFSTTSKRPAPKSKSSNENVGYTDLYGAEHSTEGRRAYGRKPVTVDPEQMAKSYDDKKPAKGSKKKPNKDRSSPARKRLSEDDGRSAKPKRRKS